MDKRTLVIYDEPDFMQVLGAYARHELGGETIYAQNLAEAAGALREAKIGTIDLIISRGHVSADQNTPPPLERSEPTAIQFLRAMYPDSVLPPCIFVAAGASQRYLEAINGLKNSRILPIMDVQAKIQGLIQELVNGIRPGRHEHFFDVEISLNGSGTGCYWRLRGNRGSGLEREGPIIIPPNELETLLLDSALVGATRHEAEELASKLIRRLGRDIYHCVLEDRTHNDGLGDEICARTFNWDRIDATRLRFEVDDMTSQLLVETLVRPRRNGEKEEDLWILKGPIFRRFGTSCARPPLYKDKASRDNGIHCLVIHGCSKTFKAVLDGDIKQYRAIENANSEVEWLIQNIGDHHSSFGMATFQVVRQADFTGAGFGKHVYDLLESGQWHLIHYIGHSDVDRDGEGHLVMGPNLGDVLSIEDFAHAASKVQFVFLNSCLSANPGFIRRLVQRDVPAAAGYAWPVSDLVARTFCEAFYKELFASKEERGFIEYAYMRAKASLREAFPNHRMWTAPLLYMQAMDSQPN